MSNSPKTISWSEIPGIKIDALDNAGCVGNEQIKDVILTGVILYQLD